MQGTGGTAGEDRAWIGSWNELYAEIDARLAERGSRGLVGVVCCSVDNLDLVRRGLDPAAGSTVLDAVEKGLLCAARREDVVARLDDRLVVVTSGLPALRDLELVSARLVAAATGPLPVHDREGEAAQRQAPETAQRTIAGSEGAVVGLAEDSADGLTGYRPSLSVGLAASGDRSSNGRELASSAEAARAEAESSGGARTVVSTPELRARARADLRLDRDLVAAVSDGALEVHYQPIVRMNSGQVDQLEALIRWRHPVRQLIPPASFLRAARRLGLLPTIGSFVASEACRQASEWTAEVGRPITISVNLDHDQLIAPSLMPTIGSALDRADLPPEQLRIEVGLATATDPAAEAGLARLAAHGVGLVIDDVGPRPGDIEVLQSFPGLVAVKLDRSLVTCLDHPSWSAMLGLVATAMSELGVEVVAQGVENPVQASGAVGAGVDCVQGFFLERPLVPSRLGDVIANGYDRSQLSVDDASFVR